jgi:hypothetical protein
MPRTLGKDELLELDVVNTSVVKGLLENGADVSLLYCC